MKVSLVATVRDAADEIGEFLASITAQTRQPDEVVIADGGSTDGTLDALRNTKDLTVIEAPGTNIAGGRNAAISAATHDVIAVSDADCVLDPEWLERLLEPIEGGADVAMGTYRPLARGFWDACAAAVAVPEPEELQEERFMPSSRSVAFRREAFHAAGGYPEWLDLGEDMYLDHRWRELGMDMRLAPEALAWWRPRASLTGHWRQYAGYARGDAVAGMNPERHAIRFAVYAGLLAALASRRRAFLGVAAAAGAIYAARPIRRSWLLLSGPSRRAGALVAVPAAMAFTDLARMAGYLQGLAAQASSRDRRSPFEWKGTFKDRTIPG